MATIVSRRYSGANRPRVVVSKRRETRDALHPDAFQTVVSLGGELDAAALNTLVDTFDDAIGEDDSDIVVDLADVDFIGAAWIGALVRSRADLRAQHRQLTVRAPSRVVSRLLDMCGLSYLIETVDAVPR